MRYDHTLLIGSAGSWGREFSEIEIGTVRGKESRSVEYAHGRLGKCKLFHRYLFLRHTEHGPYYPILNHRMITPKVRVIGPPNKLKNYYPQVENSIIA